MEFGGLGKGEKEGVHPDFSENGVDGIIKKPLKSGQTDIS